MSAVGFVGLGVMGEPMAGHLIDKGFKVHVWARRPERTEGLQQKGAQVEPSLEKLGEVCEAVFLCVNRTEDVEECLRGLTAQAKPQTLFVDHSTISPKAAEGFHRDLREREFRFIDAPITGGSMGAVKGQLTIFCGGQESDVEEAMPYLDSYARKAEHVGGPGAGQMMKMVNQIAVGGALLALCEALSFAHNAGLDLKQTKELIGSGAAGSWAFDNYGPKILERDWSPGFTVINQRKDFAYVKEAAAEIGAAIPGTDLVDELLAQLEERGQGGHTTAALFEVLQNMGS